MISSSDILHSKILIADDLQANILLLERILHGVGYDSITSTLDSREVCELHRKNRYDLILLDLMMPGMDGFQVMEGLKEIEPQDWIQDLNRTHLFQVLEGMKETAPGGYIPVIVITAQPAHKMRALEAGARDFISKPFELAEVLVRVRNMLEVRLLYKETKNYVTALEQKILEVEASRDLIRRHNSEVQHLYDQISFMDVDEKSASQADSLYTMLYIEDSPANLKLVVQLIARYPEISLRTAVDGHSGIKIARASLPDVILMDINLPGINGYETLKILQSDPLTAHIPVIAISANTMPPDIEKVTQAGFFRYITKPAKVDEFSVALNEALDFRDKKLYQENKERQIS